MVGEGGERSGEDSRLSIQVDSQHQETVQSTKTNPKTDFQRYNSIRLNIFNFHQQSHKQKNQEHIMYPKAGDEQFIPEEIKLSEPLHKT